MSKNLFFEFWKDQFGSAQGVVDYFNDDITLDAETIGVNWSTVKDQLSWLSGKDGKFNAQGSKYILKGFKHSVGIYASEETDKNGVRFPLITFKNKGGSGDTVVFNGLNYIWEEYKSLKGGKVPQQKIDDWNKNKCKRAEDAERKRQAAILEQQKENRRKAANVEKELANHTILPRAVSFVYTDKKLIPQILSHVDARTGVDKHGSHLSFLLHDVHGNSVGVQRIYENKITKPNGNKTDKDFTWGMEMNGAHFIIGDINTADRIYTVEGFATGASIYLAMTEVLRLNVAVIVAMYDSNQIKVINAYKAHKPWLDIMAACDNDIWKQKQGKGNAGMRVALELLETDKDLKAYAPNFDKVDACYKPTDFNDLHVRAGLIEVAKQLKANIARVKHQGDLFEKALRNLMYIDHGNIKKEAAKCAQIGMQVGLPKYRPSDVVTLILSAALEAGVPRERINTKELSEKATRIFHAKVKDAQSFRSFSSRITNDKLRPEHITYKKFNQSIIDDEVLNYATNLDGIVIVRFPMASGKTQRLIKPIMWQEEYAAVMAHRMSLVGGLWDVLNYKRPSHVAPITHYQEKYINDMLPGSNKLATCINSCLKPAFQPVLNNLNALCIDEAAQTLRHITAGSAIQYPVAVFNKLLSMMATTRDQIILADADANDTLVEFAELALKQRNAKLREELGEDAPAHKIHVIDGHTNCSDFNIYYTDGDTAFLKAKEDVGNGYNVLIANDSANDSEKLYESIKNSYPNKKGLLISSDTSTEKAVVAFTDSPDVVSKQYDYIIYSPSISSGVSIENGHFQKHYGIFCGTVAPSDAVQMFRRDRKARDIILGLSTMHSSREENAMSMWVGMMLANNTQLDINLNRETGVIELKTDDLQFDRFRLDLIAQENKAKNDFASNLLFILYGDGYKLHQLDTTELDQEIGKSHKEAARDHLKEVDVARHLTEKTPTEDDKKNLDKKNNLSREEKAQLNRWDIENLLMMSVNEASLDFHRKGGLNKVKLFELLNMPLEKAKEFDDMEVANGVHPSKRLYVGKQQQALRNIFEIAGFNLKTGKGTATKETLTAAIEHLTTGDNLHMFNNWYRFGGYINPFSKKVNHVNKAKAILSALGLDMTSDRIPRINNDSVSRQRYTIDSATWELMSGINTARTTKKTSAFKLINLDEMMIHSSPVISIVEDEETDQPKPAPRKSSMYENVIESLKIPAEFIGKIADKLKWYGINEADHIKLGVSTLKEVVEEVHLELKTPDIVNQ